ncbi:MAG TPA: pantoate--beta-alanine ligase [Acidimicrobiales bacterium]
MRLITTTHDLGAALRAQRGAGRSLGLVPTMGALHAGHRSLIERSRALDDVVAVSIFVNPSQFNDPTDFERYPRSIEADLELAGDAGADLVFAPEPTEMYPGREAIIRVDPGVLGNGLEGSSRPGHFSGVATVVTKLFAMFGATRAYFGEKDYEQLMLVRRLAIDLSFAVEVVGCATVREQDGLALSSRNLRLSPAQRGAAPVLYRALIAARDLLEAGGSVELASEVMHRSLAKEPLCVVRYAEVRDANSLEPPGAESRDLRVLVAASFGEVRLIDNVAARLSDTSS